MLQAVVWQKTHSHLQPPEKYMDTQYNGIEVALTLHKI